MSKQTDSAAKPPKNTTGKTIVLSDGTKIRPGNRVPFRKATNEEIQQRVEWLAQKMIQDPSLTKWDLHKLMAKRYGLHWVTVDNIYLIRAKKLLVEVSGMSQTQAKAVGVRALLRELAVAKGSAVASIERRLGEIFGYDAPRQLRVTTPPGEPMEIKDDRPLKSVPTERLVELATRFAVSEGGRADGN